MDKIHIKKGMSIASVLLVVFCYAMERFIPLIFTLSKTLVIVQAIIYTLLVGIIYLLIVRSNDIMLGTISAILAYKIVPPDIAGLASFSKGAHLLYYLVGRVAVVLFLAAIVRLYYKQSKPREIKPVVILLLILMIPFMNELNYVVADFVNGYANGNMLYAYFIGFAFNIATMLILLFAATRTNYQSAMLIINYEIISILFRTASKLCAIIARAVQGNHISKSLYCWIAIYVFMLTAFIVLKKIKLKNNNK